MTPPSPLSTGSSDEGEAGSDDGLMNENLTTCYDELGYETRVSVGRNVRRSGEL